VTAMGYMLDMAGDEMTVGARHNEFLLKSSILRSKRVD